MNSHSQPLPPDGTDLARRNGAIEGYAHHAARTERLVGWVLWLALGAALIIAGT